MNQDLISIVEGFGQLATKFGVDSINDNKFEFFNEALLFLEKFGLNTFQDSWVFSTVIPGDKLYRYTPPASSVSMVSISKFVIVEVNQTYIQAFLKLRPLETQWSHPGVFKLLQGILNGDVKRIYHNGETNLYTWNVTKLFVNMIYGVITAKGMHMTGSIDLRRLTLSGHLSSSMFVQAVKKVKEEIAIASGQRDKLVRSTTDEMLFACSLIDFPPEFINNHHLCFSNSYRTLNRICRKFNIDIMP